MQQYQTIRAGSGAGARGEIDLGLKAHMNKVYGLMSVGMLITGASAWAISGLAVDNGTLTGLGQAIYLSPLKWVIMFAPLLFVFGFGAMVSRMSAGAAQLAFHTFAVLMGLSISSIFLVYTGHSIIQTFLITAIAFAGLSLWGYTTKSDLSAWGTFLIMGVIGLLVAMIVNLFLQSPAIQFAISALGILIFAGLTAYDTQSIKNEYIAMAHQGQNAWLEKSAIMGALRLYLDFLNMFMFLLSFLGNRQ